MATGACDPFSLLHIAFKGRKLRRRRTQLTRSVRRAPAPEAALSTAADGASQPLEQGEAADAAASAGCSVPHVAAQGAALGLRTAPDACSLWGITGLPHAQQLGSDSRRRIARLLHDTMGAGADASFTLTIRSPAANADTEGAWRPLWRPKYCVALLSAAPHRI